ncbi:MAG TPA: hypothetical protein VLI90_11010 [Tepidisphaeraceae bacterium]|nr:hypothetical protein [Tepidisphaeraceae bacterium]
MTLNSGDTESAVFTGTIDSVRRWESGIEITALDAGGVMARFRPATTYEHVTASSVVQSLASDAGADCGSLDNGADLSYYVADPARTAWEHVARLAAWSGALATVSADNKIELKVVQTTAADFALRYGREILAIEHTKRAAPVASFTVAGESGTGSASSPDARKAVTDFFAGNRPDGPSATAIWEWEPALRTSSAAATAGSARLRAYGSARDAGKLTAILLPQARPGAVMEMQDATGGLPAGPVWIRRVRHSVTGGRALTTVWFAGSGDASGASLLGSAASAIGGLL